jgi:vacuolar-type H+-ATPase subunit F/Vma7
MWFYCIADEDTVRGFRLAGVAGEVVETAAQTMAALDRAVGQSDCGIVILTQDVAAAIRERVAALRIERECPLIVEIPGPAGPRRDQKSVREFVQTAVGISVSHDENT